MLQLEHIYTRITAIRRDFELEGEYLANKARFESIAQALRSRTMSASANDMEIALRHASSSPFSDHQTWTALIEKLSGSRFEEDRQMADTLRMFA